jgi:hypothetical protein
MEDSIITTVTIGLAAGTITDRSKRTRMVVRIESGSAPRRQSRCCAMSRKSREASQHSRAGVRLSARSARWVTSTEIEIESDLKSAEAFPPEAIAALIAMGKAQPAQTAAIYGAAQEITPAIADLGAPLHAPRGQEQAAGSA